MQIFFARDFCDGEDFHHSFSWVCLSSVHLSHCEILGNATPCSFKCTPYSAEIRRRQLIRYDQRSQMLRTFSGTLGRGREVLPRHTRRDGLSPLENWRRESRLYCDISTFYTFCIYARWRSISSMSYESINRRA